MPGRIDAGAQTQPRRQHLPYSLQWTRTTGGVKGQGQGQGQAVTTNHGTRLSMDCKYGQVRANLCWRSVTFLGQYQNGSLSMIPAIVFVSFLTSYSS